MTGFIHSIQTLGTLDGPGVRCVVFLQGCPLRCQYCHNPDTWKIKTGTRLSVKELLKRVLRCKPYFGCDGGVTVSGGEPLLQAGFVTEFFKACKENGIHTALDTSGCIWDERINDLLSVCDLCLLDIKALSESAYQKLCGGSFAQTMTFLKKLQKKNIPVWIRHVVVPGYNDTEQDIMKLKAAIADYTCIKKVELLPFQNLCIEKYNALGISFPFADTPQLEQNVLQKLQALL